MLTRIVMSHHDSIDDLEYYPRFVWLRILYYMTVGSPPGVAMDIEPIKS